MKNLKIFNDYEVEVFNFNGNILFNPYHVGKCLDISNSTVKDHISGMNDNQKIKLTNSKVGLIDFRKLHNTGENFLTESGVYKLILKSRKKEAEKFQDWVTDEVIPSIRKTGGYSVQQKPSLTREDIVNVLREEADKNCKMIADRFPIQRIDVSKITKYIKQKLGITKADKEFYLVKDRAFIIMGIDRWEQVATEDKLKLMNAIDASVRAVKADRKTNQLFMLDETGNIATVYTTN